MIADTVRAFYPAVVPAGAQRPPYLTDKEQAFVQLSAAAASLQIPAAIDAPALGSDPRPVVLLGPAWKSPVVTLTALGTELASQGYIVLMVNANYEGENTGVAMCRP
jgi:hypothetical protein